MLLLESKQGNAINKYKKPWYIWLSLLAFALLWGDTAIRIKATKTPENFDLWTSACGNSIKLFLFYIIGPLILFSVSTPLIFGEAGEGPILSTILPLLLLALLYFLGVYITYKHVIWRKKNIPHLLVYPFSPKEDVRDSTQNQGDN